MKQPCFFIGQREPKIVLLYICVAGRPESWSFASNFVNTYKQYDAGAAHDVVVVCNGGPLAPGVSRAFDGMGWRMFPRSNDGWDVGAYLEAAPHFADYDLLVCMGESCRFWKPGWLARIADAWKIYGEGMYGFFSSYAVRAHMNTSAFCVTPKLLFDYPKVYSRQERYEFEHGITALWRRLNKRGLPTKMVTWSGIWDPHEWRKPANILWRGDQSDLLIFCNHADGWFASDQRQRNVWAQKADTFVG